MSGRLVKRLLKEQQAKQSVLQVDNNVSDADDDEDLKEFNGDTLKKPSKINAFDLLDDQEDDEPESTENRDSEVLSGQEVPVKIDVRPKEDKSKATRKKKKGSSKKDKLPIPKSMATREEESLDKILQELDLKAPVPESSVKSDVPESTKDASILAVDPKYLRADEEMRRIFGSKVVNSNEGSSRSHGSVKRRGRATKRRLLFQPPDNWPKPDNGLSMEYVATKDGFQYFEFRQNASYAVIQRRYELAVDSHNPDQLLELLARYPFHVDSLLAIADLYKSMGEYQSAGMSLDQCLYSLESAWHPWFNPTLGNCRLAFTVDSNRGMFLALFRHMQHLGRRGCHRTALEVCKLILSLNPDDPMGVLFCIDYYALRSQQYQWLDRFVEVYDSQGSTPSNSLGLFPNFAFSTAVARFYIEKSGDVDQSEDGKVPADELLQQALMLHPSVLRKIVDKAPVKVDSDWSTVLKHRVFMAVEVKGGSLEHLMDLYVLRNSVVWRAQVLQVWLRKVAGDVTRLADAPGGSAELDNWSIVRKEMFSSDENEYKYLLMADFSDSTATLPPEELAAIQQQADIQDEPGILFAGGAQNGGQAPAVEVRNLAGQNPLRVFLETLLPWNNFGIEPRVEDNNNEN